MEKINCNNFLTWTFFYLVMAGIFRKQAIAQRNEFQPSASSVNKAKLDFELN